MTYQMPGYSNGPHAHMSNLDREGTAYIVNVSIMAHLGTMVMNGVKVLSHSPEWLEVEKPTRNGGNSVWFPMNQVFIEIMER